VFCAIVARELPASIVAEDAHTVAFMDINPRRPGHTLVVPRRHATDLLAIGDDDLAHVYATARRVAEQMRERLGCERQVIMHFHVHVIPGAEDDPELPPRPPAPVQAGDIERAAQALRG
jgi:histidine triad (HIT) family protein